MAWSDIVIVSGLILDAVGIVLLFQFAPEKFPDPQHGVSFQLEGCERKKWERENRTRNRIAKWCLVMIVTGFALQAIAVVAW